MDTEELLREIDRKRAIVLAYLSNIMRARPDFIIPGECDYCGERLASGHEHDCAFIGAGRLLAWMLDE